MLHDCSPSGHGFTPSARACRLGVVAEMVIAPANDREAVAPVSVNVVLCCKGGTFMSSGVSGQWSLFIQGRWTNGQAARISG